MKTLKLVGIALFAVLMCVNFASCSNDDVINNQETEKIKVSLGCVGEILDISHKPLSRAEVPNLYEFKIYEGSNDYATGSFSSVDNISVELNSNKTYTIEVFYHYSTETPTNEFEYSFRENDIIIIKEGYTEDEDYYYGKVIDYTPQANENVDIFMKRMTFGLNMEAVGLPEDASLKITFDPTVSLIELTSESPTYEKLYSFIYKKYAPSNSYSGILENGEYVDYYEDVEISIILKRADGVEMDLGKHSIRIQRKKITKVTIKVGDSANLTSNGFTISTEEGGQLTNGNDYEFDVDEDEFSEVTLSPQQ